MTDQQPQTIRAAITAAAASVQGFVFKDGENSAQKYRYVGHEHVIDHVRHVLLGLGIVILPTVLRFVQEIVYTTKAGGGTALLWEQTFEVSLVGSDERLTLSVQVTTAANDKASFIASTAADRTLLMRLMRLAGTSQENPEYDERDQGGRQQGGGQQRQQANNNQQRAQGGGQRANVNEATQAVQTLHRELAQQNDFGALVAFFHHGAQTLRGHGIQGEPSTRFWDAWGERCRALRLDPNEVAAAARRQQKGRAA